MHVQVAIEGTVLHAWTSTSVKRGRPSAAKTKTAAIRRAPMSVPVRADSKPRPTANAKTLMNVSKTHVMNSQARDYILLSRLNINFDERNRKIRTLGKISNRKIRKFPYRH